MLIGIISDIHGHTPHLRQALELLAAQPCTTLLCAGDLGTPETLELMTRLWQGELHLVAGNNDYPRSAYRAAAEQAPHTHYHGDTADLTLGGRRIFMAHEPERALQAAHTNAFDAIFFGHTHRAGRMREGDTLIANPGDLESRYGQPSVAVYDTTAHTLRHIRL